MGQPAIVENKPGAGGAVGAAEVARAAPDGHALLIGVTSSNAVTYSLNPKLPYQPKDLAPVLLVVSAPLTIVVGPSVQAKNLKELAALNQSLNHGSPSPSTW